MKRLITEVLSDSDSGSNSDSNCGDESNHEAELFDDEFFFEDWLNDERLQGLFPVVTIVRDSHNHKPSIRRKQDVNVCCT